MGHPTLSNFLSKGFALSFLIRTVEKFLDGDQSEQNLPVQIGRGSRRGMQGRAFESSVRGSVQKKN